jgi:hypothetical protein
MTPLETYLTSLREIRSSGEAVDETSYYGALETFFNEIGKTLKPKVRCILQLKNRGVGNPDGGFFTEDQLKKRKEEEKSLPQNPARGVIEIKPTSDNAWVTAEGEQVSRYWGKYRLVLVTNYRDFVIVGQDPSGKPVKMEPYHLAASEKEFWNATAHPKKAAAIHDVTFVEYARRVMLHAAPLAAPEDLASFLASYARDALARIGTHELPALAGVRKALEEALGLTFVDEKGEHFFRSTLVQTLFYGIFSGWVLWSKQLKPASKDLFDWRLTAYYLRVPVLRKLFHEVADPGQLKDLNLSEILAWTSAVLNRVDRATFFSKFEEAHAVQYFYEPFLQAFDPVLRKQLGVWYTPPEIVQYMVARVDTVLREELNLPDGLADKNVYVLDPCCGTGSYLVEVLNRIHKTLKEKGDDALVAADLKEAAKKRVFGFEILPAPFVVSHLQLGLLLQNLGAPIAENANERIAVFLTNALTGWEPPKEPKKRLLFPELEEERDAAEHVKRDAPILVVLGNPPYNAFAGVSPDEEQGLVEPYKQGLVKEWKIKKFNLDDLYVRFFRLGERRITEKAAPGRGVLCYISNFSYLRDPSFVVMRKRFLHQFDSIWIDCMNGDSRETGKLTPEGEPDPSVFSTEFNREGIRKGTAIGLLAKTNKRVSDDKKVRFREFWGKTKREQLLKTLHTKEFNAQYDYPTPNPQNKYSFRPGKVTADYYKWPKLTQLAAIEPFNGPVERRGFALISIDRKPLFSRLEAYFDKEKSDEEIRKLFPSLMMTGNRIVGPKARTKILGKFKFDSTRIVRYPFKPFDVRWCYLENLRPLFSEPSQTSYSNVLMETRFSFPVIRPTRPLKAPPVFFSPLVCDYDFISGHARHFPILTVPKAQKKGTDTPKQGHLLESLGPEPEEKTPNLSSTAVSYLRTIELKIESVDPHDAAIIWRHLLSVAFAPAYLKDNEEALRQDWPRLPLPNSKLLLERSAALGIELANLLNSESPVGGVTVGEIRPELKLLSSAKRVGGGSLANGDLALKAGWGHEGNIGVTMPGKGKVVERPYSKSELDAIRQGASALSLSEKEACAQLGESTCDVYLNDVAYCTNVPSRVWDYTIGGHQVIKKWLSYREQPLLGRPLTKDEVRYVQEMARRIAAILLLQPSLDANYETIKQHTFPWPPTA